VGHRPQLLGDLLIRDLLARRFGVEASIFIVDQVDHAAERIVDVRRAGADRNLTATGGAAAGCRSPRDASKIGPFAVHLVDEASRGTPYLSACRQTVSLCASTPSRALKTTTAPSSTRRQRSTSAVKSTWPGVSSRLMCVLPGERDAGGVDGDAALLLLRIVVGVGGPLVDLADAVLGAAVEQHPLGDGRLAGVDVGDDADVADFSMRRTSISSRTVAAAMTIVGRSAEVAVR
jgi:hypothetical protein